MCSLSQFYQQHFINSFVQSSPSSPYILSFLLKDKEPNSKHLRSICETVHKQLLTEKKDQPVTFQSDVSSCEMKDKEGHVSAFFPTLSIPPQNPDLMLMRSACPLFAQRALASLLLHRPELEENLRRAKNGQHAIADIELI